MKSNEWSVQSSSFAKNTFNPIRNIMENMKISPNKNKNMISLSIGDPTVFGNFPPAPEVIAAVTKVLTEGAHNGYAPSTGFESARSAVAEYCSRPEALLHAKDIILCSGCSSALDICISAMCSAGDTMLIPRPGFPLYETLSKGFGIKVKYYDLLPDKQWQVDLEMMESLIDETTKVILLNNPSNPCGSVFSKQHLLDILEIAERHKIPIIADEIYAGFVFKNHEFHSLATLTTEVPILSCGGLTKRWLIPGWRMGWIAVHDRKGILAKEVKPALHTLSQRVLGANTVVQGALPEILKNTPQKFFDQTLTKVQASAKLCYNRISRIPGMKPIMPQGAMYMMVLIEMEYFPKFKNSLEFVENLISEQSVFCLPGKCFGISDYVRIVLTVPTNESIEACNRINDFCTTHCTKPISKQPMFTNGDTASDDEELEIIENGLLNGNNVDAVRNGNGIANGVKNKFADRKKPRPFIRGSSFDVIPCDLEEPPPIETYKAKTAPMKRLIRANSIIENNEEEET